jgi:hypothetical protein
MKTLVRLNTKIDGNKVTITGELMDIQFPDVHAQRMTVGHFVSTNPHRPRMCRATNHAFMIERHGADGVAIPIDEFVAMALAIDPKLSDKPLIHKHPTFSDLVLECKSETEAKEQWQESTDGVTWTSIETPQVGFKGEPGRQYRVELTNQSGTSVSDTIRVPTAKPEVK